jgi:hypothetical protein
MWFRAAKIRTANMIRIATTTTRITTLRKTTTARSMSMARIATPKNTEKGGYMAI